VFKELELKKEPYVVELDQRGLFYIHVHIVFISLPYVTMISVYPSVKCVVFSIYCYMLYFDRTVGYIFLFSESSNLEIYVLIIQPCFTLKGSFIVPLN
jgi:hypothetical protein